MMIENAGKLRTVAQAVEKALSNQVKKVLVCCGTGCAGRERCKKDIGIYSKTTKRR